MFAVQVKTRQSGLPRLVLALAALVAVILLGNHFGLVERLTDIEGLQQWFQDLGVVGYIVYMLLYIAVAVFMLPASAVTIVAGITFGSILGGFLALISATVGACVAFLLAKYVARDTIIAKFGHNPNFKRIDDGV